MRAKSSVSPLAAASKFYPIFMKDLAQLPFITNEQYEKQEPGFMRPYFLAYIAAFQDKSLGKISHELLKKIHKKAMQHLPKVPSGEYRKSAGAFPIHLAKYNDRKILVPTYSATKEGVFAFLEHWLFHTENPFHTLVFTHKEQGTFNSYTFGYQEQDWCLVRVDEGLYTVEAFSLDAHRELISTLLDDYEYDCQIDIMNFEEERVIHGRMQKIMQGIIESFEEKIEQAKTDEEKLLIIASHIQQIEQAHPFDDGNVRTCYILLNKLLRDYQLPLTILYNPNKFDACTLSEVVKMIKDGQLIYQRLLQHQDPERFVVHTDEAMERCRQITCLPDLSIDAELLSQFQTWVIGQGPAASVYTQGITVFNSTSENSAQTLLESIAPLINRDNKNEAIILTALAEGKYALGLRRACNIRACAVIQILLAYVDLLEIQLNEASSNGNTALDWFDISQEGSSQEVRLIKETREQLVEAGALNGHSLSKITP